MAKKESQEIERIRKILDDPYAHIDSFSFQDFLACFNDKTNEDKKLKRSFYIRFLERAKRMYPEFFKVFYNDDLKTVNIDNIGNFISDVQLIPGDGNTKGLFAGNMMLELLQRSKVKDPYRRYKGGEALDTLRAEMKRREEYSKNIVVGHMKRLVHLNGINDVDKLNAFFDSFALKMDNVILFYNGIEDRNGSNVTREWLLDELDDRISEYFSSSDEVRKADRPLAEFKQGIADGGDAKELMKDALYDLNAITDFDSGDEALPKLIRDFILTLGRHMMIDIVEEVKDKVEVSKSAVPNVTVTRVSPENIAAEIAKSKASTVMVVDPSGKYLTPNSISGGIGNILNGSSETNVDTFDFGLIDGSIEEKMLMYGIKAYHFQYGSFIAPIIWKEMMKELPVDVLSGINQQKLELLRAYKYVSEFKSYVADKKKEQGNDSIDYDAISDEIPWTVDYLKGFSNGIKTLRKTRKDFNLGITLKSPEGKKEITLNEVMADIEEILKLCPAIDLTDMNIRMLFEGEPVDGMIAIRREIIARQEIERKNAEQQAIADAKKLQLLEQERAVARARQEEETRVANELNALARQREIFENTKALLVEINEYEKQQRLMDQEDEMFSQYNKVVLENTKEFFEQWAKEDRKWAEKSRVEAEVIAAEDALDDHLAYEAEFARLEAEEAAEEKRKTEKAYADRIAAEKKAEAQKARIERGVKRGLGKLYAQKLKESGWTVSTPSDIKSLLNEKAGSLRMKAQDPELDEQRKAKYLAQADEFERRIEVYDDIGAIGVIRFRSTFIGYILGNGLVCKEPANPSGIGQHAVRTTHFRYAQELFDGVSNEEFKDAVLSGNYPFTERFAHRPGWEEKAMELDSSIAGTPYDDSIGLGAFVKSFRSGSTTVGDLVKEGRAATRRMY